MFDINDDILTNISKTFFIPARPEILSELQHVMNSEDPVLADIADIISKDVAISGAILKIINSPAYGLARTVSDIKQAVMFLGFEGAYSLVQGLKLKQAFSEKKCSISLERFWDTAEEIAEVALFIGNEVKSKVSIEDLYTIGLFHDCGIPVMAVKYENYIKALTDSNRNYADSLVDIEERMYSTNHAVVGYYVANSWHLPKEICQLILRHHEQDYLKVVTGSKDQIGFAVLKMAENIVHSERRFIAAPDWPYVKEGVLDCLGFSEQDYNDLKEDVLESVFGH